MPTNRTHNLRDVWGNGPGDAYAAGYYGRIFHFGGSRWSEVDTGIPPDGRYLRAMWTTGNNVFACGLALPAAFFKDLELPAQEVQRGLQLHGLERRDHEIGLPRRLCQLNGRWMIGARDGYRCSARRGRTPFFEGAGTQQPVVRCSLQMPSQPEEVQDDPVN